MSYSSSMVIFVPFSYFMLLLSYVSVFCSTSLSLTFISSLHVSAWLPFSRTHSSTWFPPTNPHKFPVFIPHRPPFHYTCPTNYSSVIPQFSQLQHSPHSTAFSYSHTYHHTPSCCPTHKKHTKRKNTCRQQWDLHTHCTNTMEIELQLMLFSIRHLSDEELLYDCNA